MTDERDARCVTCDGLARHHLTDTGMCPAYHTIVALRARLAQAEAKLAEYTGTDRFGRTLRHPRDLNDDIDVMQADIDALTVERDQWRALAGRLAEALAQASEAADWLLEMDWTPDDDPGPGIRTHRERWRAVLAEYAAARGEEEHA